LSARSILIAPALSAWLVASVVVFSAQFELDGDRPVGSLATSFLGAQLRAQLDLPVEQRRSVSHEQSLSIQSARFFKFFGLGLMVIGLCGGLYYQL
jgi:hypothetical protein